ncbi:hypothetical protein C8F04DRAFT_1049070 [Mycena alexandri]|uniref:Uncharacterized protein n=1 Tax=Mycena alexandri TaxID=1745969 RepID=A0AAD6S759_9AGAR|nr:hypothetical protein C8F04DRAFT_1049070 [Mycena alexandri]
MSVSSEPESETSYKTKVITTVTHYIVVPVQGGLSGAKNKAKPKEKKETKTKEFQYLFEASADNYVDFLKTILAKHGEERYNITAKMVYDMKVQLSGTKKGEALDVDSVEEYKELVTDHIIANRTPKLTVFVDMGEIERKWRHKKGTNEGSDNEDVNGDDPGLYMNGLSELDRSLARFRGILEKKWQNDHDAGYTYINPDTGESHPLTPQMMKEWTRAMVLADQGTPPSHLNLFNPANRQRALHPMRIAAGVNQPGGSGLSDIAHLAGILTTLVGARSTSQEQPPPRTPTKQIVNESTSGPVIPTPSKLPRFLAYASSTLGIPSAPSFESPLRRQAFGPDILHLVGDDELMEMGMRKGDVIRLKAGAQPWWNGAEARKRTHSQIDNQTASSSGSIRSPDPATPPSKKVAFERRYVDGGAERFYGPRIVTGGGERNIYYRCPVRLEFVPVPLGYRSTQEGEEPNDDDVELDLHNPPEMEEAREKEHDDDAALLLSLRTGGASAA